MHDYWLTQYVLKAVGWGYILFSALAIALALWLPKTRKSRITSVLVVLALVSIMPIKGLKQYQESAQKEREFKERYAKAKALFDERCKTAGEKIYRTVEGVEGVLLENPRRRITNRDRADRDWLGAGFPRVAGGSYYIADFLYYHKPPTGENARSLGWVKGGINGYSFVDVREPEGRYRYRYSSNIQSVVNEDPIDAYMTRERASGDMPRYVIAYESVEDPDGRSNWIAGAKISVIDRHTQELLAELVGYAFEKGLGNTDGERSPWAFATQCPIAKYGMSTQVRSFVERVIKPKQED
jgi:hypothetical protein